MQSGQGVLNAIQLICTCVNNATVAVHCFSGSDFELVGRFATLRETHRERSRADAFLAKSLSRQSLQSCIHRHTCLSSLGGQVRPCNNCKILHVWVLVCSLCRPVVAT